MALRKKKAKATPAPVAITADDTQTRDSSPEPFNNYIDSQIDT